MRQRTLIKEMYYWLHRRMSRPEERWEYSSGHLKDMVRAEALEVCRCDEGNYEGIQGKISTCGFF